MSLTRHTDTRLPDSRPPDWANSLMKWACSTPILQRMVGQGVALISFEGRKTGNRYTIPVSYFREDNTVTIITKRQRKWWHNFESPIEVELRLAGSTFRGKASIETDQASNLNFMVEYLKKRPIDAKAYGLGKDELVPDRVARIIPQIVVIEIDITPIE